MDKIKTILKAIVGDTKVKVAIRALIVAVVVVIANAFGLTIDSTVISSFFTF